MKMRARPDAIIVKATGNLSYVDIRVYEGLVINCTLFTGVRLCQSVLIALGCRAPRGSNVLQLLFACVRFPLRLETFATSLAFLA